MERFFSRNLGPAGLAALLSLILAAIFRSIDSYTASGFLGWGLFCAVWFAILLIWKYFNFRSKKGA